MTENRTTVTVYLDGQFSPVRYEAEWFSVEDGLLIVERVPEGKGPSDSFAIAAWAPGTWQRAEITEEPAEPPHAVADRIARGYYKATGSDLTFEQDREAHGSTSVAVLLTAAALDAINAAKDRKL